ncbi:hypothetical protein B0H67DRAFT_321523 [Lasiosphaeris hirsuta]|uniref:Uncharacterized protein n=1 Tax=Lasiosphaeris hirsuta TaxID=260670 RepID=A0AA40DNK0_9PEZI|nr:hypothetical protein B0H67DRAFT_321523 [Lasiosphaeris hirsuta]
MGKVPPQIHLPASTHCLVRSRGHVERNLPYINSILAFPFLSSILFPISWQPNSPTKFSFARLSQALPSPIPFSRGHFAPSQRTPSPSLMSSPAHLTRCVFNLSPSPTLALFRASRTSSLPSRFWDSRFKLWETTWSECSSK